MRLPDLASASVRNLPPRAFFLSFLIFRETTHARQWVITVGIVLDATAADFDDPSLFSLSLLSSLSLFFSLFLSLSLSFSLSFSLDPFSLPSLSLSLSFSFSLYLSLLILSRWAKVSVDELRPIRRLYQSRIRSVTIQGI
jgi:hypothetical protein